MSRLTFVDTSFWLALRNRRDPLNEEALDLLNEHDDDILLTTELVRGETWTALRRAAGHPSASVFLDALERSPRVRILGVPPIVQTHALNWLRAQGLHPYSFVNATSFAIMDRFRVRRALAFNQDFEAAGFEVPRS